MKKSSSAAEAAVLQLYCCAGDGLKLAAAAAAEKFDQNRSTANCSQRSSGGDSDSLGFVELSCADQAADPAEPAHLSRCR